MSRTLKKTYNGFKWSLMYRELVSLGIMVSAILCIHLFNFHWSINIAIGLSALLLLFFAGTIPNSLRFKKWYKEEVRSIEYDPIGMFKDEVIETPGSDIFWEYVSVLGILVVPLSFFTTFLILVYGIPHIPILKDSAISISLSLWTILGALAIYIWLVAYPILSTLIKSKYNYTPEIRLDYKATKSVRKLKKSLYAYVALKKQLEEEERALKELEIPVPDAPTPDKPAPYVEYVGKIAEIGKSHNNVASLEQLLLSVTSFPNLDGWSNSLMDVFKSMGNVGTTAAGGVGQAIKSMSHFVAHPDKDTSLELWSNIVEHFKESGQSQFFKMKLMHSHNKLFAFAKEGIKDAGKGATDTFIPDDLGDKLHDSVFEVGNDFQELFTHFVPEFDLPGDEMFEPDFDFDGHFPIISTTREVFKNIDRFSDGTVDMGSSITHSMTKIAEMGGGAYLGAAIGSLIFPGVGTVIGGMIGGWLGKSGASKLNAMEYERLKDEFETEKKVLDSLVIDAQRTIQAKQVSVNETITQKAIECNEEFHASQESTPLTEFDEKSLIKSFSIILYDFIWDCAEQYSPKHKKCNIDKYTMLLDTLPTRLEIAQDIESVMYRMLYQIERMIAEEQMKEPDYLHIKTICKIFQNIIVAQALSMQTLHLVWMEKTRQLYTSGVQAVTETMEEQFDSLNDVIKTQEELICDQSDKCKRLAEAANNEAKTL